VRDGRRLRVWTESTFPQKLIAAQMLVKSGLLRFTTLFVLLFTLTVPFPTYFLPVAGTVFQAWLTAVNNWAAINIWGISGQFTAEIISDSTGFYMHLVHLCIVSILLSALSLWKWKKALADLRIFYVLQLICAYLLAFFLFKYGFEKVFKHQFYQPEPNTLFTPVGYLSKDILFWTTIGASYSYSVFLGLLEVLPAFLLLHRRTRLLGALIAFGVLTHVLVINLSFDISVKVLSGYLLLLSIGVLAPYRKQLFAFFWLRSGTIPPHTLADFEKPKTTIQRVVKAGIAGLILFESLFLYFNTGNFNDDLAPRPTLHGAYTITGFQTVGDSVSVLGKLSDIQRIFIHRRGYLIVQHQNGSMHDYKAFAGETSQRITLWQASGKLDILVTTDNISSQKCRFSWMENRQSYVLETQKTDLRQLPLLQPSFHGTIDSYTE
jgi:hypothetical protein